MSCENSLRATKKVQNWRCNNLLFFWVRVFDLGTAQRSVPLKTSGRFCRRAPPSCEQFPTSSSSPSRCRTRGLRFRRMCITPVFGMPGGIRYFIANNGGYISNLKFNAIAVFSFQAGEKTMFALFLSTLYVVMNLSPKLEALRLALLRWQKPKEGLWLSTKTSGRATRFEKTFLVHGCFDARIASQFAHVVKGLTTFGRAAYVNTL